MRYQPVPVAGNQPTGLGRVQDHLGRGIPETPHDPRKTLPLRDKVAQLFLEDQDPGPGREHRLHMPHFHRLHRPIHQQRRLVDHPDGTQPGIQAGLLAMAVGQSPQKPLDNQPG
ncbi:hypothetical protein QNM99_24600 [Pseudomonas sp. PCH446]